MTWHVTWQPRAGARLQQNPYLQESELTTKMDSYSTCTDHSAPAPQDKTRRTVALSIERMRNQSQKLCEKKSLATRRQGPSARASGAPRTHTRDLTRCSRVLGVVQRLCAVPATVIHERGRNRVVVGALRGTAASRIRILREARLILISWHVA